MIDIHEYLSPIDADELGRSFRASGAIRHFVIDNFLLPEFFAKVRDAFPTYEQATRMGFTFQAVNENRKVQITDRESFPEPVRQLSDVLAAPDFLDVIGRITGIEKLVADPHFAGGGMHVMASGGRLDVHVDFNILPDRNLYRRLNLLLFVPAAWRPEWGGTFELWDPDVRERSFSAPPLPNRCVVFQTSETSFHGVTPVRSPDGVSRNAFASYFYTAECPELLAGKFHSTVFRARPDERWRGRVLMPAERAARRLREWGQTARSFLKRPFLGNSTTDLSGRS